MATVGDKSLVEAHFRPPYSLVDVYGENKPIKRATVKHKTDNDRLLNVLDAGTDDVFSPTNSSQRFVVFFAILWRYFS